VQIENEREREKWEEGGKYFNSTKGVRVKKFPTIYLSCVMEKLGAEGF
jgi:hypothetical protein